MDLFGDTNTKSTCAGLNKRTTNAAGGFQEFWMAWPKHHRKVDKQACLNRWAKMACADDAEKITTMVIWLKTQPEWLKDNGGFIPMPKTWLGRQPWLEWEPEPVRMKRPDALEIIKTHQGAAPSEETRRKIRELLGSRGK